MRYPKPYSISPKLHTLGLSTETPVDMSKHYSCSHIVWGSQFPLELPSKMSCPLSRDCNAPIRNQESGVIDPYDGNIDILGVKPLGMSIMNYLN